MLGTLQKMGFQSVDDSPFRSDPGSTYLKRLLFDDYYAAALFVDDIGSAKDAPHSVCTIYLGCARFASFMGVVETGGAGVQFESYLSRKMKKDRWGTLAFAQVGQKVVDEELALVSGGVVIGASRFLAEIIALRDADAVRNFLYVSEYGKLLADIETFWVFCFLSFEAGATNEDILKVVVSPAGDSRIRKGWRFKEQLDSSALSSLQAGYEKLRTSSR